MEKNVHRNVEVKAENQHRMFGHILHVRLHQEKLERRKTLVLAWSKSSLLGEVLSVRNHGV